ncbi:mitochondrial basic amino acids transporter isoform X1 [Neodiprion virginianus]|uniref:mitochondrial basic amino acids transporter isoform X1 n=2 Tax=Neodiprion fabricii TaxID=2872261 RepID=UPI001ED97548|nr:mitochondrial basic amino acids transporter isoform X1 [Neodiprion fabricii]XP_046418930.1 mitochondrial basic amino acids transporter isoform X1 [Neodiprion fabricii]XP_046610429.1 mitochondrial basic amino acids transporter isoform X1 [Neodiprion virginianus]XP_046610430.1 mitochondrial basic amino acids transporter isoform X1 [Neodiprion virginianus]
MAFDFAAGCLGGCAGVMVGHPLDTIKVHIQTQDFRNPKYTGTWNCFRTIVARDSVAGLYRGMSSPMVGVAFVNAIVFGVYGNTQRQLSEPESLYSHFIAGAMAGIAQSPVCSSMELAKTRLQLQTGNGPQFSGPVHCLRHIYRNEGFRGIFKGLGVTFLREAPGYGIYFFTYEALTRSSSPAPISTFNMLMAGGLAGTASWIVTYPVDVIKSRLQAEVTGRYSGALDCLRQSVSAEGYACLFKGLNSTIIRAFPTNAATFTVVTWAFRLLGNAPAEAPEVQTQPAVVCKEPHRVQKQDAGLLRQWHTAMTNVLTDAHQARSYSTMSTFGLDHALAASLASSVTHDSMESKKALNTGPEVKMLEEKDPHLVSEIEDEGEQHESMSKKKDEPHVASIPKSVPELVLVVDQFNTSFGELKGNS